MNSDENKQILAVDLGGTKALLGLFPADPPEQGQPEPLHASRIAVADHGGFGELLEAYLERARRDGARAAIAAICIGVAGPVDGGRARMTNLPWELDAARIAAGCGGVPVRLVNDFHASAAAIEALDESGLRIVQEATADPGAPRVVLGAGTGLGVALLFAQDGRWRVAAGEGGHAGFAPRSEPQAGLWRFLHRQYDRVSWERVLSGQGLESIYRYLLERKAADAGRDLQQARSTRRPGPDAAAISRAGLAEPIEGSAHGVSDAGSASSAIGAGESARGEPIDADPAIASQSLDLFASAYGAFAGDLALLALARGGVYIAGGIAPKVFDARRTALFTEAFADKGRHAGLMRGFPVRLVVEPRLGLVGAAVLGARLLRDGSADSAPG